MKIEPLGHRLLHILCMLICLAALAFGVARLGIGAAMFGFEQGWWQLGGEFAEVLPEARHFMAVREDQAFFPWSVSFYFGLIMAMGVFLSAGAVQYLRKRYRSGLALMAVYLLTHGGMFLNYQEVNPKLWLFAGTVMLWLILLVRARQQILAARA